MQVLTDLSSLSEQNREEFHLGCRHQERQVASHSEATGLINAGMFYSRCMCPF